MAKNSKNATPAPKAKKPKNARQIAKREKNMREADLRLARLKAQQTLVNARRKAGAIGSDATIMRLVVEEQNREERSREEFNARQYVDSVLAGPHGERVRQFIGRGLKGGPCKVAQVVRNYLATQGYREAV